MPKHLAVVLRVNGNEHPMDVDPRATLLDTLREMLLPGRKRGATRANAAPARSMSMGNAC